MNQKGRDPLDNLAHLMSGGRPSEDDSPPPRASSPPRGPVLEDDPEKVMEQRVEALVQHAAKLCGPEPDVFEVQELIATAGDHMRYEVREMFLEDDDDDAG